MTTPYVTVIAAIPTDVEAKLRPFVDELARHMELNLGARLSGFTAEHFAWGKCLAALANQELELDIGPGGETYTVPTDHPHNTTQGEQG